MCGRCGCGVVLRQHRLTTPLLPLLLALPPPSSPSVAASPRPALAAAGVGAAVPVVREHRPSAASVATAAAAADSGAIAWLAAPCLAHCASSHTTASRRIPAYLVYIHYTYLAMPLGRCITDVQVIPILSNTELSFALAAAL